MECKVCERQIYDPRYIVCSSCDGIACASGKCSKDGVCADCLQTETAGVEVYTVYHPLGDRCNKCGGPLVHAEGCVNCPVCGDIREETTVAGP